MKNTKSKVKISLANIHGIGASLKGSSSKAVRKIAGSKLSVYGWRKKPKR